MKIKNLEIHGKTFLAPLAGITNLPFRLLVKSSGCAVVCSEMISAKAICYRSAKTLKLLDSDPEERPLSVQLFGAEPDSMAEAAAFVNEMKVADIIDINFGCSVKKVIKQGAGAALMRTPDLSRKILDAVKKATDLPLTIKIRSGWDASGAQAVRTAQIAVDSGVDALIVHPRTAVQGFRGKADWNIIKAVKRRVPVPVIGNGDIIRPEDAAQMIQQTGCDGVMVGRAAMANPFILSQIEDFLETGSCRTPSYHDIFMAMETLTNGYVAHFGEQPACRMLRGRLSWFVKGMPGCSGLRKNLSGLKSKQHALDLIQEFKARIA